MRGLLPLTLVLIVGFLVAPTSEVNAQSERCLCDQSELSGGQVKFYKGIPVTGLVCGEKDGLRVEIPFIDGLPDGMTKTYYPNGNLKMEMPVKPTGPEGISKHYDINGKLQGTVTFKQGKVISSTKF